MANSIRAWWRKRALASAIKRDARLAGKLARQIDGYYRSTPERDWHKSDLGDASGSARALATFLGMPKQVIDAEGSHYESAMKACAELVKIIQRATDAASKFVSARAKERNQTIGHESGESVRALKDHLNSARKVATDLADAIDALNAKKPATLAATVGKTGIAERTSEELFRKGAEAVTDMQCRACSHQWPVGLKRSGIPTKVKCPRCGWTDTISMKW